MENGMKKSDGNERKTSNLKMIDKVVNYHNCKVETTVVLQNLYDQMYVPHLPTWKILFFLYQFFENTKYIKSSLRFYSLWFFSSCNSIHSLGMGQQRCTIIPFHKFGPRFCTLFAWFISPKRHQLNLSKRCFWYY